MPVEGVEDAQAREDDPQPVVPVRTPSEEGDLDTDCVLLGTVSAPGPCR